MKPYIIGEFDGIPFTICSTLQVHCKNPDVKNILKNLVTEGIELTRENRKKGYKTPIQFYIFDVLEEHNEFPINIEKTFDYQGETVFEYINKYMPKESDTIFIKGILFVVPFVIDTDFNVVCNCPEPDSTQLAKWVKRDLEYLIMKFNSPAVPDIYDKLARKMLKLEFYKVQRAYIYKVRHNPNVVY